MNSGLLNLLWIYIKLAAAYDGIGLKTPVPLCACCTVLNCN